MVKDLPENDENYRVTIAGWTKHVLEQEIHDLFHDLVSTMTIPTDLQADLVRGAILTLGPDEQETLLRELVTGRLVGK